MSILWLTGTWQAKAGEVEKAVETALKAGYKHIDCAAIYGNENEVGEGIRASGVNPEDIWITSKVSQTILSIPVSLILNSLGY